MGPSLLPSSLHLRHRTTLPRVLVTLTHLAFFRPQPPKTQMWLLPTHIL